MNEQELIDIVTLKLNSLSISLEQGQEATQERAEFTQALNNLLEFREGGE